MKFQISYFSGTGCTEHVARAFSAELRARGHGATCKNLAKDPSVDGTIDFLIVCFVVHACNAPEPVMNWVKRLDMADSRRVVIISVSGGGEVTPNLACRVPIKRALKRKKHRIVYEKMLVMPSNWIVATKPILCSQLLQVLPRKISYIVNDVLNGTGHFTHPLLGNRILTALGKLEHVGAHSFGKSIKADSRCSGCGLCVIRCPVSNVELRDGKPLFGNICVLCLNCVYSCPHQAINSTLMHIVAIKSGFNFKEILALPRNDQEANIGKEAKGLAWLGVKRYLLNRADMLEPALDKESATQVGQTPKEPSPS